MPASKIVNAAKMALPLAVLLAESHLTRRLFGAMLGKIAALPSPTG